MTRVVVVGAGVIGLCCALALGKRGMDVVVLDQGVPGGGASHGNGGWICPSLSGPLPRPGVLGSSLRWLLRSDSPLYIRPRPDLEFLRWLWTFRRRCNERDYLRGLEAVARLNSRTMALFDELAEDGVQFEMHRQGLLFLFRTMPAAKSEARDLARMTQFGFPPAEWLDPVDLRRMEPSVSPAVVAGLLVPSERHVRPESLTRGLLRGLGELGIVVRSGEQVCGFTRMRGRISEVCTARDVLPARHVVLAAGVWTGRLAALLGTRLPLEAGKGYSVTLPSAPLPIRRPLYFAETRVGCSPYEGAVRILGTMELSGINDRVVPRRIAALTRAPAGYLQDWSVENVQEEWTGMRPLTPDGLPIIGPLPTADNVIVATGHAMLGITLAPATAEAVADLVTGRPVHDPIAAFRADRFR